MTGAKLKPMTFVTTLLLKGSVVSISFYKVKQKYKIRRTFAISHIGSLETVASVLNPKTV